MKQFPATGTYALILKNPATQTIEIGKLGDLKLIPGFYIYVGSAFGPGGVPARTAHHKKIQKRPHWHIDYLRRQAELAGIWYTFDPDRREHQWAQVFENNSTLTAPMPGFGASDCDCSTHLFFCTEKPDIDLLRNEFSTLFPKHTEIVRE